MTTVPAGANTTWKDAPTHTIDVGGVQFAYRELGPSTGVAVIFLTHLAAVLDNWDPRVVDGIAARSIGSSPSTTGVSVAPVGPRRRPSRRWRTTPSPSSTPSARSGRPVRFLDGRHDRPGDRAEEPQLVRKMILAGTGPAGGEGIDNVTRISYLDTARGLLTRQDPKQFLFFTRTPNGREPAGVPGTTRGTHQDRDKAISVRSFRAQLKAIHRWGQQKPTDLSSIHQPVLVINGDSDKMVPTRTPSTSIDDSRTASSSSTPTPGTAGFSSSTRTSSSELSSSYESSRAAPHPRG